MGYYDEQKKKTEIKKEKKEVTFLSTIIGAVVGALLVIFTVPTTNVIQLLYLLQPTNEEGEGQGKRENPLLKMFHLNVRNRDYRGW